VTRFVLATANPAKAAEIDAVLGAVAAAIELIARPADVGEIAETGATLEENARLKATALCDATGLPAIADDTGLEVDALGGAPGVCSARYAGADSDDAANVDKLLSALRGVPPAQRVARFRTVAIARWPDGVEVAALGTVEGTIAEHPKGRGGFGYDPVFVPGGGDGPTFAQMTAAEKHARSHRGDAFRTLAHGVALVVGAEGL